MERGSTSHWKTFFFVYFGVVLHVDVEGRLRPFCKSWSEKQHAGAYRQNFMVLILNSIWKAMIGSCTWNNLPSYLELNKSWVKILASGFLRLLPLGSNDRFMLVPKIACNATFSKSTGDPEMVQSWILPGWPWKLRQILLTVLITCVRPIYTAIRDRSTRVRIFLRRYIGMPDKRRVPVRQPVVRLYVRKFKAV